METSELSVSYVINTMKSGRIFDEVLSSSKIMLLRLKHESNDDEQSSPHHAC